MLGSRPEPANPPLSLRCNQEEERTEDARHRRGPEAAGRAEEAVVCVICGVVGGGVGRGVGCGVGGRGGGGRGLDGEAERPGGPFVECEGHAQVLACTASVGVTRRSCFKIHLELDLVSLNTNIASNLPSPLR